MASPLSLARHARRLRFAAIFGAAILPLLTLAAVLAPGTTVHIEAGDLPPGWGAGLALVVMLLVSAALLALAAMLARIEAGDQFCPEVTRPFRRFALFLLLAAVAETLLPSAAQLLLVGAGAGHRVTFGMDADTFLLLIVALVLFLVARLFDEAARLEEDSRSIV